jgi:hypothetical protein
MSSIEACSPTTKLDSKLMAYSSYNLNTLFSKDNTLDLDDPKSGTKKQLQIKINFIKTNLQSKMCKLCL